MHAVRNVPLPPQGLTDTSFSTPDDSWECECVCAHVSPRQEKTQYYKRTESGVPISASALR